MSLSGCCDDLKISMDLIFALSCGLLFSLLMAFIFQVTFGKSAKTDVTKDFSYCNSEHCVRCNKKNDIHRMAKDVFEGMTAKDDTRFDRLRSAIIDCDTFKQKHFSEKSLQQPEVLFVPNLSDRWWFDVNTDTNSSYMKDIKFLDDNFKAIKKEFSSLYVNLEGQDERWTRNSVPSGNWTIFSFLNQGDFVEENCKSCPQTTKVIHSMRNLMSGCIFGNASFSVVKCNTVIAEHFGATNARLRCHLGLIIPDECELNIANEKHEWQEGKCILFDDSFVHSVQYTGNDNEGIRAVFMLDLWHPSLSTDERSIIKQCYASKDLNEYNKSLTNH